MRGEKNLGPVPYQWAAVGYGGAIGTGKATCGILIGGAIYLGYLSGVDADGVPDVDDEKRKLAIARVRDLYQGFIERFGDTDCKTLTGCDWSKKEDVERYHRDKIYVDTCAKQFGHVLDVLLGA